MRGHSDSLWWVLGFAAAFGMGFQSAPPVAAPQEVVEPVVVLPPLEDLSSRDFLDQLRGSSRESRSRLYDEANPEQHDMLVRYWSLVDPEGFLDFLTDPDTPFFKERDEALYLFRQWGERDFKKAHEAAKALSPYNSVRADAIRMTVEGQFERDPAQAIAVMGEVLGASGGSYSNMFREVDEPERFLEELTKLPRGGLIDTTIDTVVERWAEEDPEAALAWIQADVGPLDPNDRTISVIFDLARGNSQAAMAAWQNQPSALGRGELSRNLINAFDAEALEQARPWIETELKGWYRLDVAREATKNLTHKDAVRGANLAVSFEDPHLRSFAITEAVAIFQESNPEGFQSWMASITDASIRDEVSAVVK